MREHSKISPIIKRCHYFLSFLVIFLFLCVKFDNPVDSKFDGSYAFDISNLKDKDSVSLSIFQPCTITVNELPNKYSYYYFSSAVEKDSVAIVQQPDSNRFVIFFYKPCTTTVYVNGIRPNDSKDEKNFKFKVVNPFKINGIDTIAHNDTVPFSILNDSLHKSSFVADTIRWSMGSITSKKSTNEICSLYVDDPLNDSVALHAELLAITPDTTVSFELNKTIMVRGWAPKIANVQIKNYNPQDTSRKVVNQIDSFKVILTVSDPDSSPYTVIIKSLGNDSILKQKQYSSYVKACSLSLPPITTMLKDSLDIKVQDSQNYSTTYRQNLVIKPIRPQVTINSNVDISANEKTEITVSSSSNCAKFIWELFQGQTSKKKETTKTGRMSLEPLDEGPYTLKVIPVSGTDSLGDTAICTITAKVFKYTTKINKISDTLYLKVNRFDTLQASVLKDNNVVKDSTLKYIWTNTAASLKVDSNTSDSIYVFKCIDSIAQFSINVQGVVGKETASNAEIPVIVSWYRPIFRFVENKYDSIRVNIPFKLNFKFDYSDTESSLVTTVYYKKRSEKSASGRTYDSLKGITFYKVGVDTIDMWCIDRDSTVSNVDSAFVTIVADLPYISGGSEKEDSVAINKKVEITGIVANPGKAGIPIDSIFWYRNSDSLNVTSIKVGNDTTSITIKPNGYSEPGNDTITIYCKDGSGVVSIPVKKYFSIFSDVPIINSIVRLDTATIYKAMSARFRVLITDPDDDSLTLNIFNNATPFDSVLVAKNDTFILAFKDTGTYTLKMTVKDDTNHTSELFSLGRPIYVDPGIPVVNSVKIPNNLVYIKDAVQCTVSALDYNGKINKYQYYVNDSLYKEIADSVFSFTFADSGTKKISVKVIDNDSFPSEMKSGSFIVRRGQPVVDSFIAIPDNCFVNDSITFRMTFIDSNGTILKSFIAWNGDTAIVDTIRYWQNKSTIKDSINHQFTVADTGTVSVKVKAQDDDGIFTEWKSYPVKIKKGIPKINTIRIVSQGVVYVKDSVTLSVAVSDSNKNAIQSVIVSWRNDTSFDTLVFESGSDEFKIGKKFAMSDSIIRNIHIKVTDETGMFKDSLHPCIVRIGRPEIDSISLKEVWIKDTNTLKIVARDTNDSELETYMISFDSSKTWSTNSSGVFANIFFNDTSRVGPRLVQVRVMDKDGLWKDKTVGLDVKLGRPIVRPFSSTISDSVQWVLGSTGKLDTMFFRWTGGLTTIAVSDTDFNGSINERYWSWTKLGLLPSTTNNPSLQRDGLTINDTNRLTVVCRDNDLIRSLPYTFFVYPDAAPQIPSLGSVTIQRDSIKFVWINSDLKDGDSTLFQIQCNEGTAPVTVIKPFGTCKKSGTDFYYWFKPTTSGRYYWKVTAKDARGSTSESAGTSYFDFVKP